MTRGAAFELYSEAWGGLKCESGLQWAPGWRWRVRRFGRRGRNNRCPRFLWSSYSAAMPSRDSTPAGAPQTGTARWDRLDGTQNGGCRSGGIRATIPGPTTEAKTGCTANTFGRALFTAPET